MAHFNTLSLTRPVHFNFATDVVDYYASQSPCPQAMHWTSRHSRNDERILDYSYFSRQSHRIARLLHNLSARKGDRMIIILPRIPEWWEIVTAAIRMGVVVIPCTTLLVDKDIEYRCNTASATVFVGDSVAVEKFASVRAKCNGVRIVLQVDSEGELLEGATSLTKHLDGVSQDEVYDTGRFKSEEACIIYFTSGTTGHPKMVLHNQISCPLAHTITGREWLRLRPGEVYWNLSEQGWAKAAWAFFGAWNCGASLFVHDDRQPFSPIHTLSILNKYPITTLCAPPTAYRQLVTKSAAEYFAKHLPKKLKHCVGAGEPLNAEVIKRWGEMSGGILIRDGYGQTETIMVCGNFLGNPVKPGSMGKPAPGVPIAIINDEGVEANTGEEGDISILISGGEASDFFGICEGYIDSTGRAQLPTRTAIDGTDNRYYLTGDRATRDSDGYLWFVSRSDDIINSSGYRIGPFEVESVLKLHPSIVESAVVSSPDLDRVEVVKAFIVLTEDCTTDRKELVKEIQDFCKKHAAPYKYPRRIEFVEESQLPKTISGKIKRAELRAGEWREWNKAKLAKL